MSKYRWSAIVMVIAILGITGFQLYWLKNNYDREKQNLEITTNASFDQTVLRLQSAKLKLDRFNVFATDSIMPPPVMGVTGRNMRERKFDRNKKKPTITIYNLMLEKMKDSAQAVFKDIFEKEKGNIGIMSSLNNKLEDTTMRVRDRSIFFDTSGIDPHQIRAIKVRTGKRPQDRFVSISVDKKMVKQSDNDPLHTENTISSSAVANFRPPPPGQLFWRSDKQNPADSNVLRFFLNIDSLYAKDSITIPEITKAYSNRLKDDKIDIQFNVERLDSSQSGLPNVVSIGFSKQTVFGLFLSNTTSYILRRLKMPILFSLLLVGVTIFSFVLLYRNMIRQHRLAELKNEFISNITHELKTPIATVGVAIEALKNFNAIDDAERTKEYLDISQNELQRLNLLVDKVLKLAVFEKKEIELKKECFDCRQLAAEVMNSMKLQFEKCRAKVNLHTEGDDFNIEADKLHITSVIYNLLDNALKYSKDAPVITVALISKEQHIELSVEDNGIGIPAEYKTKVFDKFFRVPTGDKHNAKGYGLGLSYVAEVIKRHHGFITMESEVGKGSIFTAYIPYKELAVMQFDEQSKLIRKK